MTAGPTPTPRRCWRPRRRGCPCHHRRGGTQRRLNRSHGGVPNHVRGLDGASHVHAPSPTPRTLCGAPAARSPMSGGPQGQMPVRRLPEMATRKYSSGATTSQRPRRNWPTGTGAALTARGCLEYVTTADVTNQSPEPTRGGRDHVDHRPDPRHARGKRRFIRLVCFTGSSLTTVISPTTRPGKAIPSSRPFQTLQASWPALLDHASPGPDTTSRSHTTGNYGRPRQPEHARRSALTEIWPTHVGKHGNASTRPYSTNRRPVCPFLRSQPDLAVFSREMVDGNQQIVVGACHREMRNRRMRTLVSASMTPVEALGWGVEGSGNWGRHNTVRSRNRPSRRHRL